MKRLVTFMVIITILCQEMVMAGGYNISSSKLAAKSRWSAFWDHPKHKLDERSMDGFIIATKIIEETVEKYLGKPVFNVKMLNAILEVNKVLEKYDMAIDKPRGDIPTFKLLRKHKGYKKSGNEESCPYLTFRFGVGGKNVKEYNVVFNVDVGKLSEEGMEKIGIKTPIDRNWLKVPGTEKVWIISETATCAPSGPMREGLGARETGEFHSQKKWRSLSFEKWFGRKKASVDVRVLVFIVVLSAIIAVIVDLYSVSPSAIGALVGGIGIGVWLIIQIKYGMNLWRKGPKYDLLDSAAQYLKEKRERQTGFKEYEYKEITGQKIEEICQGIKLSGDERNKINDLSSKKDKARRFMLYYLTANVNEFVGIVTVEKMRNNVLSVNVEWVHRQGKIQLPEEFIRKELAKRKPKGIIFRGGHINEKVMDRLLPNYSPAGKNESTIRQKKRIFANIKVEGESKCVFFVIDKQSLSERRRLYFSSFNFSNILEWVGKKQWIQSFANGLFYGLAFFSIFEFAEATGILASYTFFTEYIGLFLTVTLAPLAGARIAKIIRNRADPARSRHAGRGAEDNWRGAIQNMEMGWEMTKTYNFFGVIKSLLSLISVAIIPPVGAFLFGISSPYVYLILMFIRFVIEFVVYTYEQPHDIEVFESAIRFHEVAKKKGYADNFSNIDSFNDMFRELTYACGLLIGYGLYMLGIPTVVLVTLSILSAIAIPISSFMVHYKGGDYKNYINIRKGGLTYNNDGSVLLTEGVKMVMNPDNPNIVNPRPDLITARFHILPWVERLAVTIECEPGHEPTIVYKNPKRFKRLKAIKGRCILKWPKDDLTIELVSREKPINDKTIVREGKLNGGCIIRFYPKKDGGATQETKGVSGEEEPVPKGAPATLLKYMYNNNIFSNNPKKSIEMTRQRGGNDSLTTIKRELKVLKSVGLAEGSPKIGYYLPNWIRGIDPKDIIRDNPELKSPNPNESQTRKITRRIRKLSAGHSRYDVNSVVRICKTYKWNIRVVLEHFGVRYPIKFFDRLGLRKRIREEVLRIFREERNRITRVERRIGMGEDWFSRYGFKWLDIKTDMDMEDSEVRRIVVFECEWVIPEIRKKIIIAGGNDFIGFIRRHGLEKDFVKLIEERISTCGVIKTFKLFGVYDSSLRKWLEEVNIEKEENMDDKKVLRIIRNHKWNLKDARKELRLTERSYWGFFVRHKLLEELEREIRKRLKATNWNIVKVSRSLGISSQNILIGWMKKLKIRGLSRDEVLRILEKGKWKMGRLKKKLRFTGLNGYLSLFVKYKLEKELEKILAERIRKNGKNIAKTARDFCVDRECIETWMKHLKIGRREDRRLTDKKVLEMLEEHNWRIRKVMRILSIGYQRYFEFFISRKVLKYALRKKVKETLNRHKIRRKAARELDCTDDFIDKCVREFFTLKMDYSRVLETLNKYEWNLKDASSELRLTWNGYWMFFEKYNLLEELRRILIRRLRDSTQNGRWNLKIVADSFGVSKNTIKGWIIKLKITKTSIETEQEVRFNILLKEGEVERLVRLFGPEGALKILSRAHKLTSAFLKDRIAEFLIMYRKGNKSARRVFSAVTARGSGTIKKLTRDDVSMLADEVIASIYPRLVRNYRFLNTILAESKNPENSPLLREAYKKACEHYITVMGFIIKGIRNRGFFLKFFQRIGAKFILDKKRVVLADETGLGKTVQVIAAAQNANDGRGAEKVLIIAPKTALGHWQREIRERTIDGEEAFIVSPGKLKTTTGVKKMRLARFVVVNYEVFRDSKNGVREKLKGAGFDFVVLDEAHRIRNETDITRSVREFDKDCETIKYKVALTATPLVGSRLRRFYNILNWLDCERFPLNKKAQFVKYYMSSPNNLRSLKDDLRDVMLRRMKKDVWCDLPEKHFIRVPVTIKPGSRQARIYNNEREKLAKLVMRDRKPVSKKLLERVIRGIGGERLRQAAVDGGILTRKIVYEFSGKRYVYPILAREIILFGKRYKQEWKNGNDLILGSGGRVLKWHFADIDSARNVMIDGRECRISILKKEVISAKYERLDELIKEITERGEKAVVYTNYRYAVEDLRKRYRRYGVNYLYGKMGYVARTEEVNNFQNNPDQRVFISTYGTGGEAITLTSANNVIFVDLPRTPQERYQALGRLDRLGQKKGINIYSIIAEGTVDEALENLLEKTELVAKLAFDGEQLEEMDEEIIRQVLEGVYSERVKKRLRDLFSNRIFAQETKEDKYFREEEDKMWIEFKDGKLKALLRDKNGGSVEIHDFNSLIESYSSLGAEAKRLFKKFFVCRIKYEISHNVDIKRSIIWVFLSSLIPELKLLDYHGEYEERCEFARYIIYRLLANGEELSFEKLAEEIGDKRAVNDILYFLDAHNVFKAMSFLGLLSRNYYFEGGLLKYDRQIEVLPFNGRIYYIDKDIVRAILSRDIDTGEVMPEDESVNHYEFMANRRYRKLGKDERMRLENEVKKGNLYAKDILAKTNLRIVVKIAGRVLGAWIARNHAVGKYAKEIDRDDLYSFGEEVLNEELNNYMNDGENGFEEYFVPRLIKRLNAFIGGKVAEIKMEKRTLDEDAYRESGVTRLDLTSGEAPDEEGGIDNRRETERFIKRVLFENGFSACDVEILFEMRDGAEIKELCRKYNKSPEYIEGLKQRAERIVKDALSDREETAVSGDDVLGTVEDILRKNGFTEREISIFLRYLEDFSFKQLAMEFIVPQRMVRETVNTALVCLRKDNRTRKFVSDRFGMAALRDGKDESPDMAEAAVSHVERNKGLMGHLEIGNVVCFSYKGEPAQLELVGGELRRGPVDKKYRDLNSKAQGIYRLLAILKETDTRKRERHLSQMTEEDREVITDIQEYIEGMSKYNNIISAHALIEAALNANLYLIKREYFVGDGFAVTHAGRGIEKRYGKPRIWLGEHAVRRLTNVEVVVIMLEDALHIINKDGLHFIDIHHNWKFFKYIRKKLTGVDTIQPEDPRANAVRKFVAGLKKAETAQKIYDLIRCYVKSVVPDALEQDIDRFIRDLKIIKDFGAPIPKAINLAYYLLRNKFKETSHHSPEIDAMWGKIVEYVLSKNLKKVEKRELSRTGNNQVIILPITSMPIEIVAGNTVFYICVIDNQVSIDINRNYEILIQKPIAIDVNAAFEWINIGSGVGGQRISDILKPDTLIDENHFAFKIIKHNGDSYRIVIKSNSNNSTFVKWEVEGTGGRALGHNRMALERKKARYILTQRGMPARYEFLWDVLRSINHQIDNELDKLQRLAGQPGKEEERENIKRIIYNLRSFRDGGDLNRILIERNRYIDEDLIDTALRAVESRDFTAALKIIHILLSIKYMKEPEFYVYRNLLGQIKRLIKEAEKVAEPDVSLIERSLKFMKKKVIESGLIWEFVREFRNRCEDERLLDINKQIDNERVFNDLFLEYVAKNGLVMGSPYYWTVFYRSCFIPFRISMPDNKNKKMINPVFEALTDLSVIQYIRNFEKLPRRLKKETKDLLESFQRQGKNNFGALMGEDRESLVESLARCHSLSENKKALLRECVRDLKAPVLTAQAGKSVERFISGVKGESSEVTGGKVILALDTDIGNMMTKPAKKLVEMLKKCDMGNIIFVDRGGDSLDDVIGKKIEDLAAKGVERRKIDVVIVTNKEKEKFDKSYNVIRVDDCMVKGEDVYLPILELLTFAIEFSLSEVTDDIRGELSEIYNVLTGRKSRGFSDELIRWIRNDNAIQLRIMEGVSPEDYDGEIEILCSA